MSKLASEKSLEFMKTDWEINLAWNIMLMLAVSEMTVALILLPMGNYCQSGAYQTNGLPLCFLMAMEYSCLLCMIVGSFGYCFIGCSKIVHPNITYHALSVLTAVGCVCMAYLCIYYLYTAPYQWALFVYHHYLLIISVLHFLACSVSLTYCCGSTKFLKTSNETAL